MGLNRIEQKVFFNLKRFHSDVCLEEGIAKILTVLFLTKKPLDIEQISKKVDISRSNTFLKLKKLEEMEIIKKQKVVGSKSFLYSMDKEIDELLSNHLKQKLKRFIMNTKNILEEILENYRKKTNLNQEEKNQLKILKKCHKKTSEFLIKAERIFSS